MLKTTGKLFTITMSVLLVMVLLISTSVSVFAAEIPDNADEGAAVGAAEDGSSPQFVDPESDPDLEAELDAADLEAERGENDLSVVGAEEEIADEGADADVADDGAEVEAADESADVEITDEGADVDSADTGILYSDNYQTIYVGGSCNYTITLGNSVQLHSLSYNTAGNTGSVKMSNFSHPNYRTYRYYFNGLKAGYVTYYYTVKGFDHSTHTSFTNIHRFHITVKNLSTPKITSFSSLASGVKINWNAVSGAAKYRVYYKSRSGWKRLGDTTGTSYVDTSVKSGATYTYTVRCINSAGTRFTSGYYSSGWKYTYNMATPKITSFSCSSSGIKITWGKVTNAVKYRVYYKGKKGWVKMADTTGTSYLDKAVKYGKTYTYTVRCINSSGKRFTSSYNKTGWKKTYYLPTPSLSRYKNDSSGITLYWNSVSGAAKYRLYRKSGSSWKKIGETTGTQFLDTKVIYGSAYTYTIRCINKSGTVFTSGYNSSGWKITYKFSANVPTLTSASMDSDGDLRINISDSSGAYKYKIFYKTSSGWEYVGTAYGKSTWVFSPNYVMKGKKYTFTVQGYDSGNEAVTAYNPTGFTFTI